MNRSQLSVSLYYKLFLIFGITFLPIIYIFNYSIQHSIRKPDAAALLVEKSKAKWQKQTGGQINTQRIHEIEEEFGVKGHVENGEVIWEYQEPPMEFINEPEVILAEVFTCVAIVLLSSFVVRRLLLPVKSLTEVVGKYRDGELQTRSKISSQDEIGALSSAFNSMADRIQKQIDVLKQLAVGISHEIRSPLARMQLIIEGVSDPALRESLRHELREIDEITEVILEREKLNAGISDLHLEPIALTDLIDDLVRHYKRSDYEVIVQFDGIQEIRADRRRLEMCLKNLLDNAVHHGASGKPIHLNCALNGQFIEIRISNSSPPRGDAQKSRRFGLGLMLSDSIAKAHRGSLKVSRSQDGTATLVILPR